MKQNSENGLMTILPSSNHLLSVLQSTQVLTSHRWESLPLFVPGKSHWLMITIPIKKKKQTLTYWCLVGKWMGCWGLLG
jgi:hypothetical protein